MAVLRGPSAPKSTFAARVPCIPHMSRPCRGFRPTGSRCFSKRQQTRLTSLDAGRHQSKAVVTAALIAAVTADAVVAVVASAVVPLCHCVAVPLRCCAAVLLCRCAAVPLCRCAAVPLCRCAAVSLCRCVTVSLCRCVAVSPCRCAPDAHQPTDVVAMIPN